MINSRIHAHSHLVLGSQMGVEVGDVNQYPKKSVNMETQKRIPFAVEAILASSILLGLTVAIMSPDTVLTDSPILRAFTDFVASFIPGIDRLAKVSQFPEVTRFTSAVLWATVPLQALVSAYPGIYVPRFEMIRQKKILMFFGWLIMPLLVLMMASVSIHELSIEELARKDIYHWGLRSVSESRIWLGIIGGAVACSVATFIFIFFTFWPRTWAIYFGPKN